MGRLQRRRLTCHRLPRIAVLLFWWAKRRRPSCNLPLILCGAMLHRSAMKWSNGWWVGWVIFACILRLDAAVAPQDFKLRGIGIGMTRTEVEKIGALVPVESRSSSKLGLECYIVGVKSGIPSAIYVTLLDGKVSEIEGVYDRDQLKQVGGADKLLESLVERLGPTTDVKKKLFNADGDGRIEARWTSTEANRAFSYGWVQVGAHAAAEVVARDLAAVAELKKRQDAAIIDFKLRGVAIGMTTADVAKLGSMNDEPRGTNAKIGKQEARVTFDSGTPSGTSVVFLEGKLIMLVSVYHPNELKQLGGAETLLGMLKDRIGKPHLIKRGEPSGAASGRKNIIDASWHANATKRVVTYQCYDKGDGVWARLEIFDVPGMDEMIKREGKNAPGF